MNEATYSQLCSYENLKKAFKKARKRKTLKPYVIEFEKNLETNLLQLRTELILHIYRPKPLETFILRDPKTRKISKSSFRDRVVHHALCNIIEPVLDKPFIYDSYSNRIGKGAFKAINRFEYFSRKVTKNHKKNAFLLKADIKQYFEYVEHKVLISIIKNKISDPRIIWLIKIILANYISKKENKGMPLGNLTSQFFANVYLNELDQFIKHKLRIKYYIRYVDDFIILDNSYKVLEDYKIKIDEFLKLKLKLELHPQKSKIVSIKKGVEFLGMRIFPYHKLLKKRNLKKFQRKLQFIYKYFDKGKTDYDKVYEFLEGWLAYAKNANTYIIRKKILQLSEKKFQGQISTKEINQYRALYK
ncbi:MAG: reverse transcriptase/maturase family protein [Nanoarchaeota archaeon]|nr:reverse transcriptase/maturase family protein [Nanoarchaeota archaeon]